LLKEHITSLLDNVKDPGGAFADGMGDLFRAVAEAAGEHEGLTVLLPTNLHTPGATDALTAFGRAVDAKIAMVRASPRAARVATANQTRWHTSVFAAYAFAATYLTEIAIFFTPKDGSKPSPSAALVAEFLSTPAKRQAIQADLDAYVASMKPAADFLELVSDVSVKKPRAEHLHGMFLRLLFELDAQAEGTAGKALVAVIRAKAATYVPMKDTL